MENRFFVPVASMITGLLTWVVFLVLCETRDVMNAWPMWLGVGFCLVAGGLIAFSGISCRNAGGPRLGSIVRTAFLLIMAGVTYWRIDTVPAGVLVAAAVVTAVIAIMGERPDAA